MDRVRRGDRAETYREEAHEVEAEEEVDVFEESVRADGDWGPGGEEMLVGWFG